MLCSDQINELATALAKAQGEMANAAKNRENPHYKSKYADLASIWEACREPLSKHGLSVAQATTIDDAGVSLVTCLLHTSGQWIKGIYPIRPIKDDPQAYGSAYSYARRYGLAAMVGVVSEDDDGQSAGTPGQRPTQAQAPRGNGQAEQQESWTQYLPKLLAQWAKFEPTPPGDDKAEVARQHRIAQHLATEMVAANLTHETDLLKPAEAGKAPARDPRRVFEVVKRVYAEHPDWVRIQCRSYLLDKREEVKLKEAQPAAPAPQPLPPPAGPDPGGDAAPPAGAAEGDRKPPRTGRALYEWVKEQEQRYEVGLLKWLNGWGTLNKFPARMLDWSDGQVATAYTEACRKLQSIPPDRGDAYEEALSN